MSRRNSANAIADLSELSALGDFVFDKRQGQRAAAKKHRRNRHCEKQIIRNTLAHLPPAQRGGLSEPSLGLPQDSPAGHADGA